MSYTNNKQKELPYFNISGQYGGNQDWMRDPWMHLGGCGALTFSDIMIYSALYKGKHECYPFDAVNLSRRDYVKFGMHVKPWLRPRSTGINRIDIFIDGANAYMADNNIEGIRLSGLEGYESLDSAKEQIVKYIDQGMPVAYLMLNHRDRQFNFFEWHWFVVNGYAYRGDKLHIKTATYGRARWLCLDDLWDTGCSSKGGIVFFEI